MCTLSLHTSTSSGIIPSASTGVVLVEAMNIQSTQKNLQECAAAVAANPACGLEFSFAKKSGWCDCVPTGEGPCTYTAESGTAVYTLPSKPEIPTPAPSPAPPPAPPA